MVSTTHLKHMSQLVIICVFFRLKHKGKIYSKENLQSPKINLHELRSALKGFYHPPQILF